MCVCMYACMYACIDTERERETKRERERGSKMCGKVWVPHIGRRLQSELKTDVRVSCLRGPMWPCIS